MNMICPIILLIEEIKQARTGPFNCTKQYSMYRDQLITFWSLLLIKGAEVFLIYLLIFVLVSLKYPIIYRLDYVDHLKSLKKLPEITDL